MLSIIHSGTKPISSCKWPSYQEFVDAEFPVGITQFLDFYSPTGILKNKFQKLDLFPSSGGRVSGIYSVGPVRKS
jgi:hypothetical protein